MTAAEALPRLVRALNAAMEHVPAATREIIAEGAQEAVTVLEEAIKEKSNA